MARRDFNPGEHVEVLNTVGAPNVAAGVVKNVTYGRNGRIEYKITVDPEMRSKN